jgi:hypothetical protein
VEKTLLLEQRHWEFSPDEDCPAPTGVFDRPTNACALVTSILLALHDVARKNLEGANLGSFLTEVRGVGGCARLQAGKSETQGFAVWAL